MKKLVLIIFTVFSCLALLFFIFAPEQRVNAVKMNFYRTIGDSGQICFDYYSSTLKDPSSAYVLRSEVLLDKVYVVYRAQNSYGAYGEFDFVCPASNGKINSEKTKIERCQSSAGTAGLSFEDATDCLSLKH